MIKLFSVRRDFFLIYNFCESSWCLFCCQDDLSVGEALEESGERKKLNLTFVFSAVKHYMMFLCHLILGQTNKENFPLTAPGVFSLLYVINQEVCR